MKRLTTLFISLYFFNFCLINAMEKPTKIEGSVIRAGSKKRSVRAYVHKITSNDNISYEVNDELTCLFPALKTIDQVDITSAYLEFIIKVLELYKQDRLLPLVKLLSEISISDYPALYSGLNKLFYNQSYDKSGNTKRSFNFSSFDKAIIINLVDQFSDKDKLSKGALEAFISDKFPPEVAIALAKQFYYKYGFKYKFLELGSNIKYVYGFSISELLRHYMLPPVIFGFWDSATLNLKNLKINSLAGLHKIEFIEFITELNLKNNQLTKFPREAYLCLKKLKKLNISENFITEIPDGFRGEKLNNLKREPESIIDKMPDLPEVFDNDYIEPEGFIDLIEQD